MCGASVTHRPTIGRLGLGPADNLVTNNFLILAMEVVKETLNVAGLLTNVYARGDLRDKHSSEPVVVLFFLHGRGESADVIDPTARAAFAWVDGKEALSKQTPRDFIVVTFVRRSDSFETFTTNDHYCRSRGLRQDHRNHGQRIVDKRGNLGWSKNPEEHNERHAQVPYVPSDIYLSLLH